MTKTKKQRAMIFAAVVFGGGILAFFVATAAGVEANWIARLSPWQTLLAGLFALAGGYFVLLAARVQNEATAALTEKEATERTVAAAVVFHSEFMQRFAEARQLRAHLAAEREKGPSADVHLHKFVDVRPIEDRLRHLAFFGLHIVAPITRLMGLINGWNNSADLVNLKGAKRLYWAVKEQDEQLVAIQYWSILAIASLLELLKRHGKMPGLYVLKRAEVLDFFREFGDHGATGVLEQFPEAKPTPAKKEASPEN